MTTKDRSRNNEMEIIHRENCVKKFEGLEGKEGKEGQKGVGKTTKNSTTN